MHTRRVLSAHGACSGSLCTGNREGKRGPVLFHLFQLEGNGGRQQRRNRSQRNHTRTDAVGPAQGACRGNRSTKSAEEPKDSCQIQSSRDQPFCCKIRSTNFFRDVIWG